MSSFDRAVEQEERRIRNVGPTHDGEPCSFCYSEGSVAEVKVEDWPRLSVVICWECAQYIFEQSETAARNR